MKVIGRVLLLTACFGWLQAQTLGQIIISGNSIVPEADIRQVLVSKEGDQFSTDNVIEDINLIYEMGVFNDDITVEPTNVRPEQIDLIYTVKENPLIEQIHFVGLKSFTSEQILASLNVRAGTILNYRNLRHDIKALNAFYQDRGYMLMSIKEVMEPQEDGNLIFVIKEGIIEDIFLKGLKYTKEYVITREMKTRIGDAFNIKVLQEDMRRIYNTGYMENINIDPPLAGIDPEKVVAVLNLEEKRSGTFQFGGGIGSATGFFGFLQLEFINFLGEGYNIAVKGTWGEKQLTYELKYHNPWFFPDKTWLTSRLWHTDGQIDEGQGLSAFNSGGEVISGKPLTNEISGFLSLRTNHVSPKDASQDAYMIRSIGGGLNYDTRDFVFNPSSGEYIQLRGNTSLKLLGATVEFLKTTVKAHKFFPVGKDLALGFKVQADLSWGTIFDTQRYFAGGATTVRGYQDGHPFAVGGARALGTAELRYSINKTMNVYLFYDLGMVRRGYADVNFAGDPNLRTGVGIGFKLQTPIGPLRFDYAFGDGKSYGIDPNNMLQSGTGQIHFNIENSF